MTWLRLGGEFSWETQEVKGKPADQNSTFLEFEPEIREANRFSSVERRTTEFLVKEKIAGSNYYYWLGYYLFARSHKSCWRSLAALAEHLSVTTKRPSWLSRTLPSSHAASRHANHFLFSFPSTALPVSVFFLDAFLNKHKLSGKVKKPIKKPQLASAPEWS